MAIYLQYEGISGQNVPGLSGQWIEISSFQWGVGRAIGSGSSTQADKESSTPSVSEIVVTKPTDAVSANLLTEVLAALGGKKKRKKRDVSIVFIDVVPNFRHTLDLSEAEFTDIQPSVPRSDRGKLTRYDKLTISFPEHHFNGVRNAPLPPALLRFQGV